MNSASDSNEEFSLINEDHSENYHPNNDDVQFPSENGEEFSLDSPMVDDRKSCTCKDCGKVFNSVWYLKQHAVKHSSERPFKCKYCHKTYRFRSNLYQHKCPSRDRACESNGSRKSSTQKSPSKRKTTPSSATSYCIYADDGSSTSSKKTTLPKKLSNNSFTLSNGGATNSTTTSANNASIDTATMFHSKLQNWDVISDGGSYVSPTGSPQKFSPSPTNEEIQQFLDRHKDQLHKCPQCKMLFPSREYLTRHMSWHDVEESKVKCTFCSELFDNDQQYGLHKQSHVPHSVHICCKCKGKFCHRLALKKHVAKCRSGRFWPTTPTPQNGAYNPAMFIDRTPPSTPASESTPPTEENDVGSIDSIGSVGDQNHQIMSSFVDDEEHNRQEQDPSSIITVDLNGDYSVGKTEISTKYADDDVPDNGHNFVETVTVCNNFNSSPSSFLNNDDQFKTTVDVDQSSQLNYISYGASSSIPFVETTLSTIVAYPANPISSTAAADYFAYCNTNNSAPTPPSSSLPITANSYLSLSSSYFLRDDASPFVQPSLIPPYTNYHLGVAADVNSVSGHYQFSSSAQPSSSLLPHNLSSFYIPNDSNIVAGRSWTPDSDSNDNWLLPPQPNRYSLPQSTNDDVSVTMATPCVIDFWRPRLDNSKETVITRLHDFDMIFPGNAEICGPLRADTPSVAALVEQNNTVSAIIPSAVDLSVVSKRTAATNNALPIDIDIINEDLVNFFNEAALREEIIFEENRATATNFTPIIPKVSTSPVIDDDQQHLSHDPIDEQYQCDSCERLYNTKKGLTGHFLKIHVFTSNGVRRNCRKNWRRASSYSCAVCSCRFDSETALAAHHLSVHRCEMDDFSFVCETCSNRFQREEHLKQHEHTHLLRPNRMSTSKMTTSTMIENNKRNSFNCSMGSATTLPQAPLDEGNLAAALLSVPSAPSPLRRSSRQRAIKSVDSMMNVFQTKPNASSAESLMMPSCLMIVDNKKYKKPTVDSSIAAEGSTISKTRRAKRGGINSFLSSLSVDNAGQQKPQERFRCSYPNCQKSFEHRRYVKKHERLQHEIPAERGGESSSLVYSLRNKETYKIKCPFCVKRFASPRILKQHLAFHARANKICF